MMPGVTFPAYRGGEVIVLSELLDLLGPAAVRSTWVLHELELAPSPAAERIYAAMRDHETMPGALLAELATKELQVVEGVLEAHEESDAEPWIELRAVDGSWWDVLSGDDAVLRRFAERFPDVAPLDN
jgi:hypothetical protein